MVQVRIVYSGLVHSSPWSDIEFRVAMWAFVRQAVNFKRCNEGFENIEIVDGVVALGVYVFIREVRLVEGGRNHLQIRVIMTQLHYRHCHGRTKTVGELVDNYLGVPTFSIVTASRH